MDFSLSQFSNTFLYVYSSLITVINPIGGGLFFLSMTMSATREIRGKLAARIAVYCFFMTVVSLWIGSFILSFFGISLGVLRVGGGLVLFGAGWAMLNAPTAEDAPVDPAKKISTSELMAKAFYPLTLPLTIGPGAISVATAIGTSTEINLTNILAVNLAALATTLTIFVCFKYSDRITARLGATGSDAIQRIFSFILLCLGVQILWTGVSDLVTKLVVSLPH
ncbi:MarC family protein [Turicimonas muris]|uniref:UPF0056 membrane protein n=6 Tax=Turicimonas muris TaxID=1796652 RepID=A0A227KNM5_9BURK|nr:MarC family protein [Turicimonas muris]ANU66033.1 hypothetical protein A4V04_06135 [Burkholderiales bacterium YL45]MBS4769434.1 MarC family protein [Burkholderiales bacterium]OXE49682.1 MarC family protein [Turicimonas muris]QQQ97186.1 MarC family protein [Turicimonas muris]